MICFRLGKCGGGRRDERSGECLDCLLAHERDAFSGAWDVGVSDVCCVRGVFARDFDGADAGGVCLLAENGRKGMTGRALKPDDGVRLERIGNVVCVIARCRDDYQAMENV